MEKNKNSNCHNPKDLKEALQSDRLSHSEKLALLICGDESEEELKDITRAIKEDDKEAINIYGLRRAIHGAACDTSEHVPEERKEPLIGFIPQRLEIRWRPELINFPLNVLFASFKEGENGEETAKASALYEPAIYTFKDDEKKQSMVYVNRYGAHYLEIFYYKEKGDYIGKKYVNDKLVLESTGANWNGFFQHFTVPGLSDGEACLFE